MKSYLNASEVAKLLKVDRATVTRWAQQGKFKDAIRIDKPHQWRIPISAYEELVKTNNKRKSLHFPYSKVVQLKQLRLLIQQPLLQRKAKRC